MPGMLIVTVGHQLDRIAAIDETHVHAWAESAQPTPRGLWLRYRLGRMDKHGGPDLTDAATLGCLLHLVRAAWGDHNIVTHTDLPLGQTEHTGEFAGCESWWVAVCDGETNDYSVLHYSGHSEAEALVVALEAAP